MNFINSFLSGPQMMMLNLNQRNSVASNASIFNPSSQPGQFHQSTLCAQNKLGLLTQIPQDQKNINVNEFSRASQFPHLIQDAQNIKENSTQLPIMNSILQDQTAQSMLLTSLIISHQQNIISQLLSTPTNPMMMDLLQQQQQIMMAQSQFAQGQTQIDTNIKSETKEQPVHIESQKHDESENEDQDDDQKDYVNMRRKRIKQINICGHQDKEHYAQGMCSNCYHKFGRTKQPWLCGHDKLYARGLCQNCYINQYNQVRKNPGDQEPSLIFEEKQNHKSQNLKIELDESNNIVDQVQNE